MTYIGNNKGSLVAVGETKLVEAAKRGSHPEYAELCRRHSHVAFCMIQRITRNREDSEDVLQETLMRAFVHLDKFDGRSAFSTWFTRIAINSALMAIRKRKSTVGTVPDNNIDAVSEAWRYPEMIDPSPNPESHYAEREAERQVLQAVRGLPPMLRKCIEIRYAQDLSVAEVAAHVGISVAAAKSRLLRAKLKLFSNMTAHKNGSTASPFRQEDNRAGAISSRRMLVPTVSNPVERASPASIL
jgi:RNA polymerase sigma-70 factor (ECF subfamily)